MFYVLFMVFSFPQCVHIVFENLVCLFTTVVFVSVLFFLYCNEKNVVHNYIIYIRVCVYECMYVVNMNESIIGIVISE